MISKVGTLAGGLLFLLYLAASNGVARSAPLATCRMSQFALAFGPQISEATGQHTLALRLVNRGAKSCVVNGYPRVTSFDRAGLIPFAIRHGGDQMITAHGPARVLVRPDRAAFVLLNHYRCDRGGLRAATTVRLGLPGTKPAATASIKITDPYRRPNYCGKGDPGSTLTVSPFESTLRAALSG
jgi:Domain of unknown function (DUF4232)